MDPLSAIGGERVRQKYMHMMHEYANEIRCFSICATKHSIILFFSIVLIPFMPYTPIFPRITVIAHFSAAFLSFFCLIGYWCVYHTLKSKYLMLMDLLDYNPAEFQRQFVSFEQDLLRVRKASGGIVHTILHGTTDE